jgi:hypothetical protein
MANPQINHTYRMSRIGLGNFRSLGNGSRNILGISYGFTNTKKVAAAASTTVIMAASSVSSSAATTLTNGITQPDVPRALSVTVAATTAADIAAGNIVITGTNVEGKVITDTFAVTADTAATINGTNAFKRVTSVAVPQQDGASVTVAIGTRNIFGLNHRLASTASTGTVRVVSMTTAGAKILQAAPSAITTSATLVEANTVTPATAPNGTTSYSFHYFFYNWALDPTNGFNTYGA